MAIEKRSTGILGCIDFSGGINSSVPPQQLAENEYQVIKNFEYDFNRLRTRGGISAQLAEYTSTIRSIFYDNGTNTYLTCLTNGDVWEEDLNELHNKVGTLTGKRRPNYCRFDGKVFIASGDKLQYYDPQAHSLTTIAASYLCDYVFEENGRLAISCMGDDNLRYSAVGDPYETGWTEDTNMDSSSKWLEIGYKDDGDVLKVLPISGDIATFKTNGKVYSTNGFYTSWNTALSGDNSDVLTADAIINLGSGIAFVTNKGLRTLETIQNYGNFTINELGRKFNRNIASDTAEPRIFNLVRKRQLIIQTNTLSPTNKLYCYQYDLGACIELEFPFVVADMQDTQNGVILASGTKLYRWDKAYSDDNGVAINQQIVTREISSSGRILTRKVDIGITGSGTVYVKWANKKIKYVVGDKRRVINAFSVCRDSVLGIETTGNIEIEFVKLYSTEI